MGESSWCYWVGLSLICRHHRHQIVTTVTHVRLIASMPPIPATTHRKSVLGGNRVTPTLACVNSQNEVSPCCAVKRGLRDGGNCEEDTGSLRYPPLRDFYCQRSHP